MPDPVFLQNWPSIKPRPCRPFFSHSHAKVNYLPLASPYLKIEHLYSAGKTGHYRFWFPLIPHSQPSKVQMVVTGLPVGGGGGKEKGGKGGEGGFSSGFETIDACRRENFLKSSWITLENTKTLENMKYIFRNSKRPKRFLFTKYFCEDYNKRNGCTGVITSGENFVCVLFSSDGILK